MEYKNSGAGGIEEPKGGCAGYGVCGNCGGSVGPGAPAGTKVCPYGAYGCRIGK